MDLEPSIAFSGALFGTLEGRPDDEVAPITSILPNLDLSRHATCRSPAAGGWPGGGDCKQEQVAATPVETFTALEVAFPQWTQSWADSAVGQRPPGYQQFKKDRQESILRRGGQSLPECRDRLRLLSVASNLTFRDYLHSPERAAYGIRQKVGQFNIMGRLPVTNLYAAGQCALLPGIIGAMTSAFLVSRSLLGQEVFERFLSGELCH